MRVATLYDIHGNLPALEAVLEEIGEVDQIVVGGDVVPGPMPRETLDRLLSLDFPVQFIHGNGEIAVLAEAAGRDPGVPPQVREAVRWNAEQLGPEYVRLLASWPKTVQLQINGLGQLLFCHATPRNENEIFTRVTPEKTVEAIFEQLDVNVVICGHTHMQFDRTVGTTRIVNAGSVGMPFGVPGAYWLLLEHDVELRYTRYDLTAAAQRIRNTSYPQAEEFAARNILQPPTEKEMLELLSRQD